MNKEEALALIDSYSVTDEGKEYLADCVLEGPSRSVFGPSGSCVVGHHYSLKLHETRQFESRTGEAAVMICLDADPKVIGYYSQIKQVQIPSTNTKGHNYVQKYTPDVLILRGDHPVVAEIKPWEQITKLAKKRPHHWQIESEHDIRFLPPEQFFGRYGIKFEVLNSSLLPWILVSNTQLLLRVHHNCLAPNEELVDQCMSMLKRHAWLAMGELREELRLTSHDPLLHLITQGKIYASIKRQRLCLPETILSLDPILLEEILEAQLLPPAQIYKGLEGPTLQESKLALRNIELARTGNCRQSRRMKAKIREGKKNGLTPFESVLPKISSRGNRTQRLAEEQIDFVLCHQNEFLRGGKRKSINKAYSSYKSRLIKSDTIYAPVSRATYYKFAYKITQKERQTSLYGKKAGNSVSRPVDPALAVSKATRAFQRGLIDHALLKHLIVVARNRYCVIVRRVWLTSLVDEYSGVCLAQWLSFRNPSTEAICMLLRCCLLSWGRVPETIHSDRGADFRSAHVAALMAFLGVSRSFSPAASPKFNSDAERWFATQQKGILEELPGNLVEHNNRKTENIYKPGFKAIYDPITFYRLLFEYADIFNDGLHGSNSMSGRQMLEQSLREISSSGAKHELTSSVYLATCIPTESVWGPRRRGSLLVDGRHYYCPDILTPGTKKKDLAIRMDPWNCNVLHIQKNGKWYTAATRMNRTMFDGADICRQLGESLRVRLCRKDRDILKEKQNVLLADLIDSSIELAEASDQYLEPSRLNHEKSSKISSLQQAFNKISHLDKDDVSVEWD